jgi:glucose dehydrogenase
MAPGIYGGTEWSPGAFDPGTGWVYAANVHWPGNYAVGGGGVSFDLLPAAESRGNVVAVDPVRGRVAWETPTPRPMVGGVLSTAGGLVFAGRLDGRVDAYHARTGERLWSASVEAGCASAPVTYEAGGRQHVALTCGGHFLGGSRGDLVAAFALPDASTGTPRGSAPR